MSCDETDYQMLDCLILGDSIAQGIAMHRPECTEITQKGVTSLQFRYEVIHRTEVSRQHYSTVVISLGTNDKQIEYTEIFLRILREQTKADLEWWIMPQPRFQAARKAVLMVADTYGDQILEVPEGILERDKIHPTAAGYKLLAEPRNRPP